jgi:FkbM family methyltransferase
MRIDNFLLSKKISTIDILKIDTEVFEFEVIKGLGDKITLVK